ncbi:MAG: mannose-6-phosphate isomerase, class I [Acidimicrobiales bacterium]|nr:mannose-6-phosphate isomerase, class I [Acidimicrobiales bacterium]MDG2218637.1 mannose-6-phosphate isomerase, class I [Acidimicrobiales bacterium]
MQLLEGVIRHYDWGSVDSIPELLGVPATGEPWAELWLGAHPSAPSSVGGAGLLLDDVIAADPVAELGSEVADRFGRLPFMVKVLSVGSPLSLQAHPSISEAEAGFDRENAAGIPVDAPHRSFRDRNHKPELICALTEFDALCGFRDPMATLAILNTIDTPALDPVREHLRIEPVTAGLDVLLAYLLTLSARDAAALVNPVVDACRADGPEIGRRERAMAVALGARYPGDAGVVAALLLNFITLAPGEGLFLGAGNLHAYLQGTAVEIMANSDNVLRGGLTPKHIDVETLLAVVDVAPICPDVQCPARIDGVTTYDTPVPDFSLQRIEVDGARSIAGGPAIFLCTDGVIDIGTQVIDRGAAAWISAEESTIELSGQGAIFRAAVGALNT